MERQRRMVERATYSKLSPSLHMSTIFVKRISGVCGAAGRMSDYVGLAIRQYEAGLIDAYHDRDMES